MRWTYLAIDFFTILVPLVFSFHPKLNFYKNFRYFGIACLFTSSIFICWDIYFTKIGVWGFNKDYIYGVYLWNLPLEEILFFICIPFSCLFTYHCLQLFYAIEWVRGTKNFVNIFLIVVLVAIGSFNYQKLYTSVTFISTAFVLIVCAFYFKVKWLHKLISIYPILLIPFFIVNGILTGTGIEHPVVWYNDQQNLGIRLLTIPIEDIFYGFELILINVFFYEYAKEKALQRNIR